MAGGNKPQQAWKKEETELRADSKELKVEEMSRFDNELLKLLETISDTLEESAIFPVVVGGLSEYPLLEESELASETEP